MTRERDGPAKAAKGTVVACSMPGGETIFVHEHETAMSVARAIAALKGFAFQEGLGESGGATGTLYFVPDDSLLATDAARLGIKGPEDLFGGVVPWRFAMTKVITHELVDASAERPQGWSAGFGRNVEAAVLPGCSAFSRADAVQAAKRLARFGRIRLKPPLSSRGRDQQVVRTVAEVEAFLERYPTGDLEECGLVLEADLHDVTTLSIGHTVIDEIAVVYCGTQRTTTDNAGQPVYGGSDLLVMRGSWRALEDCQLPRALALASAQARTYDAAMVEYPGLFASRRNYDIGQGVDSSGTWRSGVLEACLRIGGSSTAELAAVSAMKHDPEIRAVRVSTVKEFGNTSEPPANADIHFHGEDPEEGPVTRYTAITEALRGPVSAPGGT